MARKKGGKSKGVISKGQRPNVSRWTRNAMRRDHKANLPNESKFQAEAHRSRIISSPQNAKERDLKTKYLADRMIESRCADFLKQFASAGLTRAGAIHAIKTGWESQLIEKWKGRKATKAGKNKEAVNG